MTKRIAILSGKGGSCKSTNSVNVGYMLSKKGKKVGILDLDLTGSNIQFLLKMESVKFKLERFERIKPFVYNRDGVEIEVMGISFFTHDFSQPMLLNGSKSSLFVQQMVDCIAWSDDLDYLIVDCPPSSSSELITLLRHTNIKVDGVIISVTPSSVALIDCSKTVELCRKLDLNIIGVVGNMSKFVCPNCKKVHKIFGDGIDSFIKKYGLKLLLDVPLDPGVNKDVLCINALYLKMYDKLIKWGERDE